MIGPSLTAPIRTCVGCRTRGAAAELVRLALVEGRVTVDARRRLPGRGASVHPSRGCIEAAVGRGAFGRAFRTRVQVPAVEGLWQDIESLLVIGTSDISASGRTTT